MGDEVAVMAKRGSRASPAPPPVFTMCYFITCPSHEKDQVEAQVPLPLGVMVRVAITLSPRGASMVSSLRWAGS